MLIMKKILNIAICFGLGYFAAMVTLPPVERFEKTRCLLALGEDDKGNTIILDYETYKSLMEEIEEVLGEDFFKNDDI